jgi:hypothetical protein
MARTLSRADAQFNIEQNVIISGTNEHVEEWNIPEPWFSSTVIPAKHQWETIWDTYIANPAERTKNMTFVKNATRKTYEPIVRQVVAMLKFNPNVTDADLELLGIAERRIGKRSQRIPAPTDVPDFRIEQAIGHRLIIHFHAHGKQRKSSVAKPHGVHGAEIVSALLDVAPSSHDSLIKSSFCITSPYTFTFDLSDAGKTLYTAIRWENSRGEKGPWSDIQSAIVP